MGQVVSACAVRTPFHIAFLRAPPFHNDQWPSEVGCVAASEDGENAGRSDASTRAPPKNLMADFFAAEGCRRASIVLVSVVALPDDVVGGTVGSRWMKDGWGGTLVPTAAARTHKRMLGQPGPTACVLLR
ncbi:hypothetical protein HPB50_024920 [Hyalomma asiaticum]|uniref:Uncharacterized protein n=1 Tax=Hyalomma asiaticum TaxID=266040 RepID=A0ACB7SWF4_HYAAI|nr:hypothetical protein HPB50_024920 [Hyalomma asiaticum]